MNHVILSGNVTADPVQKTIPGGKSLAEFTLAVDRGYGDKKQTDFFRCTVWESRAEPILKFVHKGDKLLIVGEVTAHAYIANGEPRASLDVRVDSYEFQGTRKAEPETKEEPSRDFRPVNVESLPF